MLRQNGLLSGLGLVIVRMFVEFMPMCVSVYGVYVRLSIHSIGLAEYITYYYETDTGVMTRVIETQTRYPYLVYTW